MQDQTVYEKYKNAIYKYLRKLYPEAEEPVQYRILKAVWEKAAQMGLLYRKESEREVLISLLALTEQEIYRERMRVVRRDTVREEAGEAAHRPAEEI